MNQTGPRQVKSSRYIPYLVTPDQRHQTDNGSTRLESMLPSAVQSGRFGQSGSFRLCLHLGTLLEHGVRTYVPTQVSSICKPPASGLLQSSLACTCPNQTKPFIVLECPPSCSVAIRIPCAVLPASAASIHLMAGHR